MRITKQRGALGPCGPQCPLPPNAIRSGESTRAGIVMEAEPTLETRVAGKWGATVVADPPCSVDIFGANWSLYIKVPGCRIRFSKEQVDTLRAALHTALARPEVAAVMTAQAFRYGVV